MLILVMGGSCSGKSKFAEQVISQMSGNLKYYLATMQIMDEECKIRAARHQAQRSGLGLITVETPWNLKESTEQLPVGSILLLECMSNLLANEQFDRKNPDPVNSILSGISAARKRQMHLIVVTNSIFSDGIDVSKETIQYMDYLGQINCCMAKQADCIAELICSIPVIRKGEQILNEILA